MNAAIRTFCQATDKAGVIELWREVFSGYESAKAGDEVIRRYLEYLPELFLVAVSTGQVVGTVKGGYDGSRGWVYSVATHPDFRRRGIARALMLEVESRLRALGCPKINLQVRGEGDEAVAFYRSLGYRVEPRVSMGKRMPQGR